MTNPEHPIGPSHESDLEETLRRERIAREDLESKVVDLERRLNTERAKLERLSSRKSVRAALRIAALARPAMRVLRRRQSTADPAPDTALQSATAAAIRHHRSGLGPKSGPLVTMVVLNRDGARHLAALLPALRDNTTYRSFELVVVDNGSTDESIDLLEQDWGFPIHVIRNSENVSFSRGCNQGIAHSAGPYVLLLNNDITPINAGWLGALVASLEEDPDRGAAGALLIYPERPGYVSKDRNTGADLTVQHRGIHYQWRRNAAPSATVPWAYNMGVGEDPTRAELAATVEVPAATAACLLIRADLLDQLGGLDEGFTYGMEDVDLSLRIRAAGFEIVVVGAAALYHHEFGTQSAMAAARKRSNGLANLQHFSEKWGSRLSRLLQLESLLPQTQRLRHRPPPVVAIAFTASDPGLDSDRDIAHELGEALASAGYSVVPVDQDRWYELGDNVVALITLEETYDVRKAPPDATIVAWVYDRTDRWIAQQWFGQHDVYIPGTEAAASLLASAGVAVSDVMPVDTDQMQQLTQVAHDFSLRPRIALKVGSANDDPASTRESNRARGLADALRKHGAPAQIHAPDRWEAPASQCIDVAIHMKGPGGYSPKPAHTNILWILGPVPRVSPEECAGYDVVLVESDPPAEDLRRRLSIPVEVTSQPTDGTDLLDALATRLLELVDQLGWEPRIRLEDC
jgi:GT2 family glycosyltransferase